LATRVRDSEAVALVTADGTTRRGNEVPLKRTVDEAIAELGNDCTLKNVFVVRHLNNGVPMAEGRDLYFDQLNREPAPIDTAVMDPNDPLCIVYTSGTTGRPKGILHSHGGLAVKAALDFAYGFDVKDEDVIAWISDMGWLVGPLMIMGGLQLGATVVFTEGLPNHPEPTRLFDLIDRNGVTLQGVAPTAMRAVMASSADHDFGDLASLRAFVSTGEAWDDPTWWWLYETVGRCERPIINYSGGTEVGGGLLVAYPFLPMEAAAFNGPLPGLDVAVLNVAGDAVVGEVGELAVRNTFPGMTHAFWQDEERYLDTYWRTWKDTWQHGDLASVDDHGTWRIHGRSDDTIKVSGRRIGPAELEASLLRDPRIVEAAVIGVPDERRGQSVTAFVVLRSGEGADHDDLVATAVQNVGRSFAPNVHVVASLPKTKNGKIVRRAIRARHLDTPVGDTSSLDPLTPLEDIPVRAQTGDK
jgi:acetyl-CoA synthetase